MQLGNTDKWYVDQTQSDYEALAVALKAQYPKLRVGIGPAFLNDQYQGTNPPKQQIEDFIAVFVPSPLHEGNSSNFMRKAPSSATVANSVAAPSSTTVPKPGDRIWVLIPGIGPVDALFVAALPEGQVLIDLDGVQTPVEQSTVHRDLEAAEAAAVLPTSTPETPAAVPEPPKSSTATPEREAAPEPPKALTAAPEPEAAPEPPKVLTAGPEPEAAPKPSQAPEPQEAAPEEPPAPQAESS